MKRSETEDLLRRVRAHWPTFNLGTDLDLVAAVGEWWEMLQDVELPHAVAAMRSLSQAGREFAPTPGQLRREALKLTARDDVPDPDQAVAEVFDQIRAVGYLGQPKFTHPAVDAAVAAVGGWQEVCRSENLDALRAHLRSAYEHAAARARRDEQLPASTRATLSAGPRALGDGR